VCVFIFSLDYAMATDHLGVWRDDVDEAEDGYERHADEPHDHLLPESQRLQEAHLGAVPDTRQVLLAVGMSYKLYTGSNDVSFTRHSSSQRCCNLHVGKQFQQQTRLLCAQTGFILVRKGCLPLSNPVKSGQI